MSSVSENNSPMFFLPHDILSHILYSTGELFNLSRVCKLFKKLAEQEEKKILSRIERDHGANFIAYVFEQLPKQNTALIAKLDTLFHLAMNYRNPFVLTISKSKPLIPYCPSHLQDFLSPYTHAESMRMFWGALGMQAPLELQLKMSKVIFNENPVVAVTQARVFFIQNQKLLSYIEHLDLSGLDLKTLPAAIGFFTNLLSLTISDNSLVNLPSEIFKLKKLTRLLLDHNRLNSLPKEISSLIELKYLSCGNNNFSSFPQEITDLSKLEVLIMYGNTLSKLPESIEKLSSLRVLSLESNEIQRLPESIGNLNLEAIYLYNNQLKDLPESICRIRTLCVLSVPNNQLTELPEHIGKLQKLSMLILDDNFLEKFPEGIANLKNLQELHVNNNPKIQISDLKLNCLGYEGTSNDNSVGLDKIQKSIDSKMVDKNTFLFTYNLLGADKWKEFIDGVHHEHGPFAFDLGLHGGAVEPGFYRGMSLLCKFLKENFGRKLTAKFYLEAHKIACGHFNGAANQTHATKDQIGVFRKVSVYASFAEPHYPTKAKGIDEFYELKSGLINRFGSSFNLGKMIKQSDSPLSIGIVYGAMTQEQIKTVFNLFMSVFYSEIFHALSKDQLLIAIAKLIRNLEWLHPPKDGCGRTDTAFLNFLLTSFGFNPVLLDFPYISSCVGLEEWVENIKIGMDAWNDAASKK